MNFFEDLIVELKEENLLETTVIETGQQRAKGFDAPDTAELPDFSSDLPDVSNNGNGSAPDAAVEPEMTDNSELVRLPELSEQAHKKPRNGKEFYKKRAVGEVSNLQMVEHVLTGVEREYMKVVPNAFDDFKAKTSLHAFLNMDENENSEAHAEAEFALLHETEAWCTALAERDRKVPVYSLRQCCENSRPALSSQALVALARFYRNLPYSESVRSKFDFVITRLFSRAAENDKRACLFTRDEAFEHVNNLYKDWSSIALYSADGDDSKVTMAALSFDDLAIEAENASTFDQLIEGDFFGRLRQFKESISELFYAPVVTAAAIDCNIRIGNAYVSLIGRERQKMNAESIQSKYRDLNDEAVSDAAGRTLALVDILRGNSPKNEYEETRVEKKTIAEPSVTPAAAAEAEPQKARPQSGFIGGLFQNAFSVNRWIAGAAVLLIAVSFGLYVWSSYFVSDQVSSAGVTTVTIDDAALREQIKTARVSGETLYALMLPSWDTLPKEKRLGLLQKVYLIAKEKGCKQVNLTNSEGKTAGYASATRTEVPTLP